MGLGKSAWLALKHFSGLCLKWRFISNFFSIVQYNKWLLNIITHKTYLHLVLETTKDNLWFCFLEQVILSNCRNSLSWWIGSLPGYSSFVCSMHTMHTICNFCWFDWKLICLDMCANYISISNIWKSLMSFLSLIIVTKIIWNNVSFYCYVKMLAKKRS